MLARTIRHNFIKYIPQTCMNKFTFRNYASESVSKEQKEQKPTTLSEAFKKQGLDLTQNQSVLNRPERYIKGLYDKRGRPVMNYFAWRSFKEHRYPALEANPPVLKKRIKYPDWEPLSVEEAEKRHPYRYGLKPEDFDEANAPEIVRKIFSWDTASLHERNKRRKAIQITRFQKRSGDTGTTPVQIAVLTEKIKIIQEHLQVHKKDKVSKRRLGMLLTKRKKMLKYLMKRDPDEYYKTMKGLELSLEEMYKCSN